MMLPLVNQQQLDKVLLIEDNKTISYRQFLIDVIAMREILPEHSFVINLCQQFYPFMVSFFAAALNQQVNLLPHNDKPRNLAQLATHYLDVYCITDQKDNVLENLPIVYYTKPTKPSSLTKIPTLPAEQMLAVVFTSGSTGQAVGHQKYWGELCQHAELTYAALGLSEATSLISTVPMQHMYGFEHAMLMVLRNGCQLSNHKPFFATDLQQTLQGINNSVLLTTPLHLRFFLDSELVFEPLQQIISATAFLDKAIAEQSESVFACPLLEIYGSSESGVIATRRPADTRSWQVLPEFHLQHREDGVYLSQYAEHYLHHNLVKLDDELEVLDAQRFHLLGRQSDMLKIAGKRMSLADLTIKLNSLPGVQDAVVIETKAATQHEIRLIAFVVAPEIAAQTLKRQLSQYIDAIFLPRRFIHVDKLPRNAIGKLAQAELQQLAQEHCQ